MTDEYLSTTSDGVAASIAAAEVMDRLAERLKAAEGSAGRMKETKAAADAVAELAADADDALAVIDSAKNTAGDVAMKAQTKKSIILDALEAATVDVRTQAAEAGLSLDHGYALDRFLEENLETVRRIESTDHHSETTLSWQFSDGTTVEMDDGTHLEKYNFYKKLAMRSRKKLQPDLVSEEVGNPDEDGYERLSLGPESRPWHEDNWIRCITDLLDERLPLVEQVGDTGNPVVFVPWPASRTERQPLIPVFVGVSDIFAHEFGLKLLSRTHRELLVEIVFFEVGPFVDFNRCTVRKLPAKRRL